MAILQLVVLSAVFLAWSPVSPCTLRPAITDLHMYSEYNADIEWALSPCNNAYVIRYQIQQLCTDSCNTQAVETWFTLTNETSAQVTLNLTAGECYLRIRAELSNGSFSAYSECTLINQQFQRETRNRCVEKHRDTCVPITARCGGTMITMTFFYLNGEIIEWPENPLPTYNITYNGPSNTFWFCFTNVTKTFTVLEACYAVARQCVWCSGDTGDRNLLLSRASVVPMPTERDCSKDMSPHISAETQVTSIVKEANTSYSRTLSSVEVSVKTTNIPNLEMDKTSQLQFVFISIAVFLITTAGVISLIVILLVIRCKKSKNFKRESENKTNECIEGVNPVYDEPTFFCEPVYEEVNQLQADNGHSVIETTRNVSYKEIRRSATRRNAQEINLNECPAYHLT